MAETHVTESLPAPSRPPLVPRAAARPRRLYVPAVLLPLLGLAAVLPGLWRRLGLDPEAIMPLTMACMLAIPVTLLLLAVWLLLLSGLRWRTRLLAFAVVYLLPPAALAAAVRKVEWTGFMHPRLVWRWTPDEDQAWERYAAAERERTASDLPPIDVTIDPQRDFPRYRGANADGVVPGVRLRADGGDLPEVWRHPCGGGYAGFAVAGNVLVTIEQRRDREAVVCYDQATGRPRWEFEYEARFRQTENMGGDGSRATPAIADGDVYSLGALGHLLCLDGKTGAKRWMVNVVEDNGSEVIKWGMTSSPLIVDDKVIVCAGVNPSANAGKELAAYDRATGKRLWASGDRTAGYSSPMLATLAGKRQVLMFDGGGLAGFDPDDGRELWRHPWKSFNDMNIIQPVLCGDDRVFISSDPARGGALLKVVKDGDRFRAEQVWKTKALYANFSNPVLFRGHLYGLSGGVLTCLDVDSGAVRWRGGDFGNGQLLLLGDMLLVTAESDGKLFLVRATPDGLQKVAERELFDRKLWNTPAAVGDRLFVRNHVEMACLRLPVAGGRD